MKLIDNLRQRVTEFNELLQSGRLIQSIILENEYVITDMNSEDQLYEQGVNRLGVNIMDYAPYSPLTIEIKKEKGQPYNRVTLRDEGDFEQSFYVEADTQQFTIKAADWKTEDLIQRYGRQILGLTGIKLKKKVAEEDGKYKDSTYYGYRTFATTREVIQANQLKNETQTIDNLINLEENWDKTRRTEMVFASCPGEKSSLYLRLFYFGTCIYVEKWNGTG